MHSLTHSRTHSLTHSLTLNTIGLTQCHYMTSLWRHIDEFIGLSHIALPWVPGAFHARFPVSPLVFSPSADEAPRRTRERISGTQGNIALFFFLNIALVTEGVFGSPKKPCLNRIRLIFPRSVWSVEYFR